MLHYLKRDRCVHSGSAFYAIISFRSEWAKTSFQVVSSSQWQPGRQVRLLKGEWSTDTFSRSAFLILTNRLLRQSLDRDAKGGVRPNCQMASASINQVIEFCLLIGGFWFGNIYDAFHVGCPAQALSCWLPCESHRSVHRRALNPISSQIPSGYDLIVGRFEVKTLPFHQMCFHVRLTTENKDLCVCVCVFKRKQCRHGLCVCSPGPSTQGG